MLNDSAFRTHETKANVFEYCAIAQLYLVELRFFGVQPRVEALQKLRGEQRLETKQKDPP